MQNQQYSFFFSDIVGYSKMVERDESLAHRMLKEHNKIIDKAVISNDGRVVKYIGDSVFAEFASSDNACKAGLKIQDNLKQRNSLSRKDERIHIRLGVHTGNAIREEGDLFGNDINIASRIESIAQPNSVFISDAVLQNVNSPSDYHSRQIEHVKLKNIHTPQTLHKLYPSKKEWEQESSAELAEALIETGVNFIDAANIQDYDTKSIGILVFESLGDPYYGYGLCNDLISEFNRISQVYISDIQDVIKYKDSDIAPPDIGRKLEVDNIIDGVCRIENDRIHLSIRMMSLKTGKTIWKEELSELTANLNVLRGTIVKRVLEILEVQVPEFILEKMSKGMSANPKAYKLYHEGLYHIEIVRNTEEYSEARDLFKKAIEYDNNFIESYAQLAITKYKMGHTEQAEEIIDEALDKCDKLDNEQGRAKLLESMGLLYIHSYRYKKALKYFQKALHIYVKYEDQLAESKTFNNLSMCYNNLKEPDKGIEVLEKSIYLKERLEKDNLLGSSLAQLGNSYKNKFQYVSAIKVYQKALGKFTKYDNDYLQGRVLLTLARCFLDIGLLEDAQDYIHRSEVICKKFNEPLIMGRIKHFKANIGILKEDYDQAIHCFEDSLEIFRDGELRKPSAEIMLEIMCTHIIFGHPDKLVSLKKNYERILKKLTDADRTDTLMDCILYYINSHTDPPKQIDIHEIEKVVNGMDFSERQYMAWWILAKSSGKLGDVGREKDYYANAVKIIQKLGDMIGDEIYRKSFLNKFPIREIIEGRA